MRFILICLYTVLALFAVYSIIPNIVVRIFRWRCLWRGPRKRAVALTFDDGPDPNYTPQVLDVLRDCNVKATFFVIAEKALKHREIIQRMIREGHDVQVHGWKHEFVPLLTPRQTVKQFAYSSKTLEEVFGLNTSLYRPTWGLCNLVTMVATNARRRTLVTWSIMVGDWRLSSWETLMHRIVGKLHPGAIIVLHDSDETVGSEFGAPRQVIALLPKLIDYLRNEGYETQKVVDWL